MGDTGEDFKAWKEHKRDMRNKYGVKCPKCLELLPKANPSILLPQQRCKIHNYRDARPITIKVIEDNLVIDKNYYDLNTLLNTKG
tara:strand:- start:352 stop:606 length:255 start_codon:yes stop_codon:yes gene_type:complete